MKEKLTDDQVDNLQLKLTNAQRRVFVTCIREGQTRRVRLFIAPKAGEIVELTLWLKYDGIRMDKHQRAIVAGQGHSAAQHAVESLSRLVSMELKQVGTF